MCNFAPLKIGRIIKTTKIMAKKQAEGAVEVNETLNKTEVFFDKYKKVILISVVAVIAIIVGVILYQNYVSEPRENKASTELGRGQEYFNAEQFDKALNGDGANYTGFLKIASDYSGTDAANLANLYAGLCYAYMEKWEDAVKYLDQYSPAKDALVSPAAIAALGNAYAHVNQLDKAVENLLKAADMADKRADNNTNISVAPTFRQQAAILLESQGKKEEALKIYKEIKKKYINSSLVQSQEIDRYIERASR